MEVVYNLDLRPSYVVIISEIFQLVDWKTHLTLSVRRHGGKVMVGFVVGGCWRMAVSGKSAGSWAGSRVSHV